VVVKGLNLPGVIIEGRTDGHDGAKTKLLYKKEAKEEGMVTRYYDYHQNLNYQRKIAFDLSADINSVMEMEGLPEVSISQEMIVIAEMIRKKCESRYGREIPDSNYEIRIEFR